jgi:hypothetical protein
MNRTSGSMREANHGRDTKDEQIRFQKWISDSRSLQVVAVQIETSTFSFFAFADQEH